MYQGKWNNTTEVAIKTLRQGSMTSEQFLHEALIMHKLRHEKLVRLFAVCSKCEPIYIITELMANGNLLNYLRSPIGKNLKLPVLIDMATQVNNYSMCFFFFFLNNIILILITYVVIMCC